MRKTNEASLFSYNGESINEGEQRKAAVAVAVAAVVTVELQTFLMAVGLYLCIVNGDVALCSVNKNSPLSPAKRTTRVGIFDVTQNGRGRGPWVDLPWGGAKPLPKPF